MPVRIVGAAIGGPVGLAEADQARVRPFRADLLCDDPGVAGHGLEAVVHGDLDPRGGAQHKRIESGRAHVQPTTVAAVNDTAKLQNLPLKPSHRNGREVQQMDTCRQWLQPTRTGTRQREWRQRGRPASAPRPFPAAPQPYRLGLRAQPMSATQTDLAA